MEFLYHVYVSDGLKALTESMAGAFGGSEMSLRWNDIYKPQVQRDAENIISNISNKLNSMGSEE